MNIRKGDNIDDVYHRMSKEEGLNFYKSSAGDYYVELGRYIEKVSDGSVKEDQLLKNKCAIDKDKIVRLKDLEIDEDFSVNDLRPGKRLIKMDGLLTVNNSIKRFTKEIAPESFRKWDDFCFLMLSVVPLQIQKRVEKNLRKELSVMEKNIESAHCMIDKLKEENEEMQEKLREMKKRIKSEARKKEKSEDKLIEDMREMKREMKEMKIKWVNNNL